MDRAKKTIKAMRAISDITEGVIPNSLKVALDMRRQSCSGISRRRSVIRSRSRKRCRRSRRTQSSK